MAAPSYGKLNVVGFGNSPNYGQLNVTGFGSAQAPLAGSYLNLDKQRIQEFKDAFGNDLGAMAYLLEQQRSRESDPKRLKEMLDVLGPYQKDVARESQRLGMESNLFAGIMDIPNKFSRALAAQHYYMPETMQAISANIGRTTPFLNRQYAQL